MLNTHRRNAADGTDCRQVVDDFSSGLDHPRETREHINAKHQNMCRFSSNEDDGYIKVLGALERYLAHVSSKKDEDEEQSTT